MLTLDELMKVISKVEIVEVITSSGAFNPYKDLPLEWHEYGVKTIYSLFNPSNKETFISVEVMELEGSDVKNN